MCTALAHAVEWLPCAGDGPSTSEFGNCSPCHWFPLQEHGPFQQDQVLFVDGLGSTKVKVLPDHRAAEYCGKKLKEEKIMRLGYLKSGLLSEAL